MNVDYIIVGFGLAGMSFAKKLEDNNKSFIVINNTSQQSSRVAAGMFNPVILKRFSPVWNGVEQLETAIPFYEELENKLAANFITYQPIYRVFKSVEEQNNWMVALDNPSLSPFMEEKIIPNNNKYIQAEFGCGVLKNTGVIQTKKLLDTYQNYLTEKQQILNETFDYNALEILENSVNYKNISASKIVFCEGFGVVDNPFFNVPLKEAKGEVLVIHAPNLQIDFILKSAIFLVPLGNDLYKVGATYNWKDKTNNPTKEAKEELLSKLNTVITCNYNLVDHLAGIRPTVKDRRPLLGKHKEHSNLYLLNGLGTRGVMLAPTMTNHLFDFIENGVALPSDVNWMRFG